MGDFNRHHPLWEDMQNRHLFNYTTSQPLIDLIADFGLVQLLPNRIPTLQSLNTGNWTRPDNIFGTEQILDMVISCTTDPEARGPKMDHLPIQLILDTNILSTDEEPHRNWRDVDWEKFNEALSNSLSPHPPLPLATDEEFQFMAGFITQCITETVDKFIPHSKPCPHSKHWWTKDLSSLRKKVAKLHHLAYKMRGIPLHEELKRTKNEYTNLIQETKKQHWQDWLEDIKGNDIWTTNHYVTTPSTDGGKTRIPTLTKQNPDGTVTSATTNEEKSRMIAQALFPSPPLINNVTADFVYPDPIARHVPFTPDQLFKVISNLSGFKVPGPDGICNIVFKHCSTHLVPYLTHLFNGVFTHRTYYEPWRRFTTVVLHKPGKPSYSTPKAYWPIALLNMTCKLLTAVVAERTTYLLERHQLLPSTHFGGRPGRSTTNSLHLLEETIRNAWRSKKIASVLFLDIEGAFPNAVTGRLLHNMRKCKLPRDLVDFTERLLTRRKTQLRFDSYISEWIPINNGIGQGDPLSMILYIIYNSNLVEVARLRKGREALKELTLAFVDDTAFIAIAKDFEAAHSTLQNMLEHEGGGFEWSTDHNSHFEMSKFALMDFSMNRKRTHPNMLIQGNVICPSPTHKFLGVMLDQELWWHAQVDYAVVKGIAHVMQIQRLSTMTKGIPMRLMHQLYHAVAIPKMLYAADMWFTPAFRDGSDVPQRGSLGVVKRRTTVQRIALLAITGAMRSTATDILEVHANVLPMTLLLQNICHRAIVRLSALPKSHPLHSPVHRAAKIQVLSHRSSLHKLMHLYSIVPADIETLNPARRAPSLQHPYKVRITDRETAVEEHAHLTDKIQVYCDGSNFNKGIGVAAVLFRAGSRPRILRFHLGKEDEHTVFEAEEVRLTLAVKLLATEEDLTFPLSISIDNQAALQAGENLQPRPGSYIADYFDREMRNLAKQHPDFDATLRWSPGHEGIHRNEMADKEAKASATSRANNSERAHLPHYLRHSTLPLSISALKQAQRQENRQRWKRLWATSPRFNHIQRLDPEVINRSSYPKRLTGLLMSLRSQHIPLNRHLHRINKSEHPYCPYCPMSKETTHHFLVECPQYQRERHILHCELGWDTSSIPHLLSNPNAIPHLVRFINSTHRLKQTFGEVPISKKSKD